jgi:hypothetical protein
LVVGRGTHYIQTIIVLCFWFVSKRELSFFLTFLIMMSMKTREISFKKKKLKW